MSLNKYKPRKPPCQKLHVRKDFKCLSHDERVEFMEVLKTMYENGIMDKMTAVHWRFWGEIHKFADFIFWHRWFLNEFEKEMTQINENITLPYWVKTIYVEMNN